MGANTEARYTIDDLWDFPEDGQRRELIDGVLYLTPLARVRHQRVVSWLTRRIGEWTDRHGGEVFPGVNVDLDEHNHLEPDVAVLLPDHGRDLSGVGLDAPADIVVEVSSPSTKRFDTGLKRYRYQETGAREFWFVDLDTDEVRAWRGAEWQAERYGPGDTLTTPLLPSLTIQVADLLCRD